MDSLQHVKSSAAQWVVRRHGSDWTAADAAALEAWLTASMSHRVEYLCHEKTWRDVHRVKVLGAGAKAGAIPTLEDWQDSPYFKHVRKDPVTLDAPRTFPSQRGWESARARIVLPWAAVFLLTCAGAYLGWDHLRGPRYSTSIGVTTAVPLPDGSKLILNTNSKIRVSVSKQARRIELEQGEVYFEVAPDPTRPFVVNAGSQHIVVLGTKFSVRRNGNGIRVVVTEGKVRLGGSDGEVLTAGAIAETRNEAVRVEQQPLPKAEALLSWRQGYLLFDEVTLAEAVAEFNLYNTHQFVIQDPAIAHILVTGHFRSTSVEPFARLLEEGFAVKVTREEDRIILGHPGTF